MTGPAQLVYMRLSSTRTFLVPSHGAPESASGAGVDPPVSSAEVGVKLVDRNLVLKTRPYKRFI